MNLLPSMISKNKKMAEEKVSDDPIQNAKFRYCVNVYNVIRMIKQLIVLKNDFRNMENCSNHSQ